MRTANSLCISNCQWIPEMCKINVRKYKVWCGCLLIGHAPRSFWDATFQHRPCLCVYMNEFAVSSIKWRKIEVKNVKLIKSKTREKFAITGRSSQFVHAFSGPTGLFFFLLIYISYKLVPVHCLYFFYLYNPGFSSVVLTSWPIGGLAHLHIPAKNRLGHVACTKSKGSV